MKVRAKIVFDDLKEGKRRQKGDEFIVSQERYEEIITKGGKNWVEEVKEENKTKTKGKA